MSSPASLALAAPALAHGTSSLSCPSPDQAPCAPAEQTASLREQAGPSGNLRLAGPGREMEPGESPAAGARRWVSWLPPPVWLGLSACPTTPSLCWGVCAGRVARERSCTWAVAAPSSSSTSSPAQPRPGNTGRPAPCAEHPCGAACWLLPPDTWVSGQHTAQVGWHGPGCLCQKQ